MNQFLQDLQSLKTHASKRFWISTIAWVLCFFLASQENLLTPMLKGLPGLSSFLQKFHLTWWSPFLLGPLSLLWKNSIRKRSILFWTALLNVILLHAYYILHGIVPILSLFVGYGLPLAWCAYSLLKASLRHIKDPRYLKYLAVSVGVWILFALCYPPLPLGPLAFVVFIPWLYILTQVTRGQAITLSFWSGFIHNAIMYYWIYYVIGVGPGVVVAIGLALLLSWFALFTVLIAFLFRRIWRWGSVSLVLFPLVWIGLEVLRTFGEISFPWAHIAYTLGDWDTLIQSSAWLGAFGLGALMIFTNVLGLKVIIQRGINLPSVAISLALPLVIIGVLYLSGRAVLDQADMSGEIAKVTLVQPSIIQSKKWDKKFYRETIETTMSLIERPENQGQDLIILPETAIPNYIRFARKERSQLRELAYSHQADIFFGILDFDKKGPPGRIYNFYNTGKFYQANDSSAQTKINESSYSKIRLVPFSEKLPWDDLFPVLNYVNLGEGDFRPGTETPVYGDQKWAPNICYETIYPDFVRRNIRSGAKMIVNITNDGWFGRSTAPYQHLNLVKFRAVENGIPVARSANTGVSALIDQYGRIQQQTELFDVTTLQGEVHLKTRETLYSVIGDLVESILFWSFWLVLGATLLWRPTRS